jgi:methyl-accepting chemotaxis protein
MDLNEAIKKHTEWKIKFRTAIAAKETMDAETTSKDNCCELGKWLHGEAKTKYGKLSSYKECVAAHAAFHVEAGKVAKAINAKKYAEAEAIIDTSFQKASSAVGAAVMQLKKEAGL